MVLIYILSSSHAIIREFTTLIENAKHCTYMFGSDKNYQIVMAVYLTLVLDLLLSYLYHDNVIYCTHRIPICAHGY